MEHRAHTNTRVHTPRNTLHFSAERQGSLYLALRLPPATFNRVKPLSLFWLHLTVAAKRTSGMDQPAIGVLQVRVKVLVFLQGLRCSEGQLPEESGRVGGGLGGRLEADLLLHEMELVADEVVEFVLVAHAVV